LEKKLDIYKYERSGKKDLKREPIRLNYIKYYKGYSKLLYNDGLTLKIICHLFCSVSTYAFAKAYSTYQIHGNQKTY